LTKRWISVLTRVSPVADEYKTVWVPILLPLYKTENRRLPVAAGKTIAVSAPERRGKAQLTAPANAALSSARRGKDFGCRMRFGLAGSAVLTILFSTTVGILSHY
jgi:hypothetical protein